MRGHRQGRPGRTITSATPTTRPSAAFCRICSGFRCCPTCSGRSGCASPRRQSARSSTRAASTRCCATAPNRELTPEIRRLKRRVEAAAARRERVDRARCGALWGLRPGTDAGSAAFCCAGFDRGVIPKHCRARRRRIQNDDQGRQGQRSVGSARSGLATQGTRKSAAAFRGGAAAPRRSRSRPSRRRGSQSRLLGRAILLQASMPPTIRRGSRSPSRRVRSITWLQSRCSDPTESRWRCRPARRRCR